MLFVAMMVWAAAYVASAQGIDLRSPRGRAWLFASLSLCLAALALALLTTEKPIDAADAVDAALSGIVAGCAR